MDSQCLLLYPLIIHVSVCPAVGLYHHCYYWLQIVAMGDLSSVPSSSQHDVSGMPATLEMLSPLSTIDATVGSDLDDGHDYGSIGSVLEMPELTHDR